MKRKILLISLLGCYLIASVSCKATEEQIKETELATIKEKLLEDMHEDEVKELVNALSEMAKEGTGLKFIDLSPEEKKDKDIKDNYLFNILDEEKRVALLMRPKVIKELPEYKKLSEIHSKYHLSSMKNFKPIEDENDEEVYISWFDIMGKDLKKWNISEGKIQSEKNIGKYKLIENTVCPFCRPLIDDYSDEGEEIKDDGKYLDYIFDYYPSSPREYFKKVKLFAYYLNNPYEMPNFENTLKYVEKQFEIEHMPLYTLKKLIDEYNNKKEQIKKNDEFGLNEELENYKKSLKGKLVKIKAKISNVELLHSENSTTGAIRDYYKMVVYDSASGYSLYVTFNQAPKYSASFGGWLPTAEDAKKFKKNSEITFISELYADNKTEWYDFLVGTDLHLGYSEIVEIK